MRAITLALLAIACGHRGPIDIGPELPALTGSCPVGASATIRGIAGLWSSPNPFSHVPEGALSVADEVTARTPGEIESRRGMGPSLQFNADRCFPLPNTTKILTTSRLNAQPTVWDPDLNTTTVLLGSAAIPIVYPYASDPRVAVQALQQQNNLYFTTAHGVMAAAGFSSYASNAQKSARPAGLPRPPAPFLAGPSVVGGSMSNNSRRTYRVTLAMYDSLGNFYESSPSEPVWLENTTGGPALPFVDPFLPPGTGLNFPLAVGAPYSPPVLFFRIWRALETALGVSANDEMFLVTTVVVTNTNSLLPGNLVLNANGFIDTDQLSGGNGGAFYPIPDYSTDSLLSVPLYTNPQTGDGFGIASSNDPPPAAGAIATFKGRTYYGRPTFRQTLQIQIIGTGTGGVAVGDTITIDGITYTGVAYGTDNRQLNQFGVRTSPGDVANNVELTARSLMFMLNLAYNAHGPTPNSSGSGYTRPETYKLQARYLSNSINDFGRIEISRIFPATLAEDPNVAFSATTSSPGFSFPNGTRTSTDNYAPGGLSWSKPNQPEAVPPINFTAVGDRNAALLGFSVHRDAVIIYKEDGAWILRDDGGPQPTIELLDASVITLAPNSIGVVNNLAYMLTARGVLEVSEQGTLPVSEPIHADLIKLLNLNVNHDALAFGVGYESERLYVLGVPATSSEQGCSYQYVLRVPDPGYPPAPPRWTRWLVPGATAGCILPSQNKLVLAYASRPVGNNVLGAPTGGIMLERKGGVVSTDFYDYGGSVACPATVTTNVLIFASDVHLEIRRGDKFIYNPGGAGTKVYTATVLSVAGTSVTLDNVYPFTGGTLTYLRAIQSRWRFTSITLGEPTMEKQWNSLQAYFEYLDGDWLDVKVDSETTPLAGFSAVYNDPLNDNQGGQIQGLFPLSTSPAPSPAAAVSTIQWLRNCRDVLLRLDPAMTEARGARLGVEMLYAQAQSNFRLASISASVGETNTTGSR